MREIHSSAKVAPTVTMGHFVVIEEGVEIKDNVKIGHNVVIHADTIIEEGTMISDGTILGKAPASAKTSTLKLSSSLEPLKIGKEVTIGANAILYRGSTIGNDCFIADLATLREHVQVGHSVIIGRNVAVENHTTIGDKTKIQTNSYITAHTTLESNVFIAPCVTTTNDNFMGRTEERFDFIKGATVKEGARVGGASILLPGITVAEETFVAAGAIVTKDTEAKTVVKGIPAKPVREVPERELLK